MQHLDYDIARGGWIGDYPDVNTFLDMWRSDTMDGNNNNNTGWRNTEYDGLIELANGQTDPKRRAEIFAEAERLLLRDMPVAPLYFYVNKNLVQPWVGNWHDNAWNYHPFNVLTITGAAAP